jgi:hypothetical protein
MSRGGAKPGERRGGRQKGTLNKATVQRQLIAAQIAERTVADARTAGRKLAKEVLEDFMLRFVEMAERYKPTPREAEQLNPHADEDKFWKYADAATDCAHKLAPYQSPTYRAVAVAPAPDATQVKRFTLNIFDHDRRQVSTTVDGRKVSTTEDGCALPLLNLDENAD